MKHTVIVHGWKSSPSTSWKPWLKSELENAGFKVDIPAMPHPDQPVAEEWVAILNKLIKNPDEHTYLVGHSLGCITILKWLETLKPDQVVGGVILVAGFATPFGTYSGQHDSFFEKPLDFVEIRSHCGYFAAIHSDNDPVVDLDQMKLFQDNLGAEAVILSGMGHFGTDDGILKLPIVRNEILDLENGE